MNKRTLATVITILAVAAFWSSKVLIKKSESKSKSPFSKIDEQSYWTCPMHPQIHSDKPGECPICHMKLVQVKAQATQSALAAEKNNRTDVVVSAEQVQLLGIQKIKVEKMDLEFHIPISGRLISATTVAFQVFEGDLRYIKPGLSFSGQSSYFPDTEILGTIISVDSIVDPTSRTVRVVGSIKKGPSNLISETTFRGEISFVLKNIIAIPESSVLHTGTGDLVYLVKEDQSLTAKTVNLGLKSDSYYEVLSGLSAEQIISSGPNFLIDSEAKIRGTSDQSNH